MKQQRAALKTVTFLGGCIVLLSCIDNFQEKSSSDFKNGITRRDFCTSAFKAALGALVVSSLPNKAASASPESADVKGDCFSVGLDVNDVSIMWPLPGSSSSSEIDSLISLNSLDSAGRPLLPDSLFFQLISAGNLQQQDSVRIWNQANEEEYRPYTVDHPAVDLKDRGAGRTYSQIKNWKVNSLRVDPCAKSVHVKDFTQASCTPQIRLVAQPLLVESDSELKFLDPSIHLIYNIAGGSSDELKEINEKIAVTFLKLKALGKESGVDTSGHALGVYPPLAVNGLDSKYARKFKIAILDLFGSFQTLVLDELAFLGVREPDPWIFFSGKVHEGELRFSGQLFKGEGGADQLVFAQVHTPIEQRQQSGVRPNAAESGFSGQLSTALLLREKPLDFDRNLGATLAKINNPLTHGRLEGAQNNSSHLTCVTCHTADSVTFSAFRQYGTEEHSPILRQLAIMTQGTESFFGQAQDSLNGLTPVFDPSAAQDHEQHYNVHNFSYFDGPSISQRTLNESLQVAQFLNQVTGLKPEGASCELEKVWRCLASQPRDRQCLVNHCSNLKPVIEK